MITKNGLGFFKYPCIHSWSNFTQAAKTSTFYFHWKLQSLQQNSPISDHFTKKSITYHPSHLHMSKTVKFRAGNCTTTLNLKNTKHYIWSTFVTLSLTPCLCYIAKHCSYICAWSVPPVFWLSSEQLLQAKEDLARWTP